MRKKKFYIAYGSNLNKAQMAFRCPTAKPMAEGLLLDHRLVFHGSPYGAHANVIPEAGQKVPIVIWEIGPADEAHLDVYEGVRGGYYTKEYMTVEVNGKPEKALIYIMTPHDFGIPADYYLDIIADGYLDFNLPVAYLNEAVVHAKQHMPELVEIF